jgi:hypothetical protein
MSRTKGSQPPRLGTTYRLDQDLVEAMDRLHERDGILPSEQVRRALRVWLEQKGVLRARVRPHRKQTSAD